MRRERLGFRGSITAAMKAAGREAFGFDPWGFVLALLVGVWWWVRGAPAASDTGTG